VPEGLEGCPLGARQILECNARLTYNANSTHSHPGNSFAKLRRPVLALESRKETT